MRSKAALGARLTTVHVLQGKYALDPKHAVEYAPDIVVKNFSDLLAYGPEDFRRG
jgi:phosphoglycolate phosphatase-like HAD superfamily hydrolase